MKSSRGNLASIALGMALLAGCAHQQDPSLTSAPASAPAATFTYPPASIQLIRPAGWIEKPDENYQWSIVPQDRRDGEASITLDVPTLPPHIPGLIPIGRVQSGYLEDLRKKLGQIEVQELQPPKLPATNARLVRVTWKAGDVETQQTALLMVHDDHVLILRARSQLAHEKTTREALDAIVASIQWIQ